MINLVEAKRDLGVFLTVLGVGRGNLNEGTLEQIANNGNGNYEYLDNIEQLRKVFIYEYSKFLTVAKDVKVQVEFNTLNVESYRLIGYENRILNQEDFEDDEKDAGEIGANQNITALYEIVPSDNPNQNDTTFSINLRYKLPDSDSSIPIELEIFDHGNSFDDSSDFMKFTAGVASFSMLIRNSEYMGTTSYNKILNWTTNLSLPDEYNFKSEFRDIVERSSGI